MFHALPPDTHGCSKYVSKDSNKLMATASVLIAAEAHCKTNKSRAADAETSSVRAAPYLLTNTVNRVVSAMELSDQQVCDVVGRLVVTVLITFLACRLHCSVFVLQSMSCVVL
jgi:hypothetical protein